MAIGTSRRLIIILVPLMKKEAKIFFLAFMLLSSPLFIFSEINANMGAIFSLRAIFEVEISNFISF
jgi:hypothetical protein